MERYKKQETVTVMPYYPFQFSDAYSEYKKVMYIEMYAAILSSWK